MKRNRRSGNRFLSAMVALGILAALNTPAYAMEEDIISYGGYNVFRVQYFDFSDKAVLDKLQTNIWDNDKGSIYGYEGLVYNYTPLMKQAINGAFGQWAEILYGNARKMKQPAQFLVGTAGAIKNAFAGNVCQDEDGDDISDEAFYSIFQQGITVKDKNLFISGNDGEEHAYGKVSIGKYIGAKEVGNYGWTLEPVSQQMQSEIGAPLQPIIFHEIGHSLGISSNASKLKKQDENGHEIEYYGFQYVGKNNFDAHLYDQRGVQANENQKIVTSLPVGKENDNSIFYVEYKDYYELSPTKTDGRVYFKGDNVSEVLKGNGEEKKKFQGVDGIPVLGWESGSPEFSHINLARSLMSHHDYRSYNTFIEAELAIMQDIGYDIDRRNFFGRSIYSDGNGTTESPFKNTQGYFARNEAGTEYETGQANTATLGIGLHVYGSKNNIIQTDEGKGDGSADLLACGTGGAGIRIDGVKNTVTVDKGVTVSADGENGRGILVAYGNNNNVVIDGTVIAAGDGGDGVRFDFGSNSMGGNMEYRGSYLRYKRTTDYGGNITSSNNIVLDSMYKTDTDSFTEIIVDDGEILGKDLEGPMGSLTVNGRLYGKDHAVYIAKNAFVDKIVVNDGAQIEGDIVSDWKHFGNRYYDGNWGENQNTGEKLQIQYGGGFDYDKYHKDLVTNLNFNGNTELDGNIIGSDNMKMTVVSGTLKHSGNADVVNVTVNSDATLLGGSYKVNRITNFASGGVDNETGIFTNAGTIGPLSGDANMVISSNETSDNNSNLLVSNGTLQAHGGGNGGTIVVKGTANISGSTVTAVSMLPGESKDVIRADSMMATGINIKDAGLLDLSGIITTGTENKISISAKAIENLTGASASQAADYASINRNFKQFADSGSQREMRAFYGLSVDEALEAIDELNVNDKAGSGGATASQGSTLANRVLSSRLATAFGQAPATLSIGGASLDEGDGMRVEIPVMLPEEKQETSWVKFTKNWGNTSGSSNYTGSAVTLGYDWKQGEYGRDGIFASYSTSSYGHADGSENVQDTRLGYYSGLNKGADTFMWYADMGYIYGRRSRGVNFLGIPNVVRASYNSYIFELGGEWKHALHAPGEKTWQASPYGAVQLSYMKNEGYKESGSIKAYDVSGGHNFYSAVEGGMEFSRFLPKGSLNLRFGIRQALTGTDYQEQDTSRLLERTYNKANRMDRTHFVTSLATETEFQPGWQLSTELGFQKGAHDKDVMASIQFRRLW